MAHEILSVKLCQLDDRLEKLHTRIHISETANHDRLQQEIAALEQECAEIDEILKKNLCHSKAPLASVLSQNYGLIEQTIQKTGVQLHAMEPECQDGESFVEKKSCWRNTHWTLHSGQRIAHCCSPWKRLTHNWYGNRKKEKIYEGSQITQKAIDLLLSHRDGCNPAVQYDYYPFNAPEPNCRDRLQHFRPNG